MLHTNDFLQIFFFSSPARPTTPLSVGTIVPPPRPASRPKLTSGKLSGINEIVCTQVFLFFNYSCFDLRCEWYLSVCPSRVECLEFSAQFLQAQKSFPKQFFLHSPILPQQSCLWSKILFNWKEISWESWHFIKIIFSTECFTVKHFLCNSLC